MPGGAGRCHQEVLKAKPRDLVDLSQSRAPLLVGRVAKPHLHRLKDRLPVVEPVQITMESRIALVGAVSPSEICQPAGPQPVQSGARLLPGGLGRQAPGLRQPASEVPMARSGRAAARRPGGAPWRSVRRGGSSRRETDASQMPPPQSRAYARTAAPERPRYTQI